MVNTARKILKFFRGGRPLSKSNIKINFVSCHDSKRYSSSSRLHRARRQRLVTMDSVAPGSQVSCDHLIVKHCTISEDDTRIGIQINPPLHIVFPALYSPCLAKHNWCPILKVIRALCFVFVTVCEGSKKPGSATTTSEAGEVRGAPTVSLNISLETGISKHELHS